MRGSSLLVVLAMLGTACPPPATEPTDAGCTDEPALCAVSAPATCAPGAMPVLGSEACQPVGWSACPPGFTTAPSGFGCIDVLPASACAGATREALGSTTCTPVGDCAAPFPPAGATHFVDAAFSATQLDATHFRTINGALRAAPSGAIVSVQAGTYAESLAFPRPVTLVGRCAAQVLVTVLDQPYAGLDVTGTTAVEVRGLTVTRASHGVQVFGGGALTLRDVVFEANRELGFLASGAGSQLTLERCVVRGTRPSGGVSGWGGVAERGGAATLRQCAVTGNSEVGVVARDAQSRVVLEDSAVLGTLANGAGGMGRGLLVQGAARLEVTGSAVVGNRDLALFAAEAGSEAVLQRSVLRGTLTKASTGAGGRGVGVQEGARVTLTSVSLSDNGQAALVVTGAAPAGAASELVATDSVFDGTRADSQGLGSAPNVSPQFGGWGLAVQAGARASLTNCAVVGNSELGVMATGAGTLFIAAHSLVAGTRANIEGNYGRGLAVQVGALAQLDACAVLDNLEVGLDLDGTGGSSARLDRTLVRHTLPGVASRVAGNGVIARFEARLDLDGCALESNGGAALTYSGSSGTVKSTRIKDNGVGLQVQDGVAVREVEALPSSVAAHEVLVARDTRFEGNLAKQGTAAVALPTGMRPAAP